MILFLFILVRRGTTQKVHGWSSAGHIHPPPGGLRKSLPRWPGGLNFGSSFKNILQLHTLASEVSLLWPTEAEFLLHPCAPRCPTAYRTCTRRRPTGASAVCSTAFCCVQPSACWADSFTSCASGTSLRTAGLLHNTCQVRLQFQFAIVNHSEG